MEFWVDDCLMLEMLTSEMQQEYQRSVTIENWRAALANLFRLSSEGEPIQRAHAA